MLAADLRGAGVVKAFGLISDDTALFITAIEEVGVRFIGSRHENSAVAMAEGFAMASGSLGVAVIGRGPGAANCANALINSSRSSAPLLVIMGDQPWGHRNTKNVAGPDLKALDAERLFSAANIATLRATNARSARTTLQEAIAEALTGKTVVFLLPVDVQQSLANSSSPPIQPSVVSEVHRPAARESAVALAVNLLARSDKPIIVAGYGCVRADAGEAVKQLAEKTGALLITSLHGKDLFRNSPYDLGICGSFSHSAARKYVQEADCILSIGVALNHLTSSFGEFFPAVPLIQVDENRRHIGRYCYADIALVGDARTVTEQLLQATLQKAPVNKPFHSSEILHDIKTFSHDRDFTPAHTDYTVDMRSLALRIDEIIPKDREVVFDLGNFFAIAPYISVPGPRHVRYVDNMASIGLGFGTALGVAAAKSGRSTYLFIGDGALLMTLGELETMAREDLPLVIFVFNDHAYGAERHFLAYRGKPISSSVFPSIDFAPIAENFGIESHTVKSMKDLDDIQDSLKRHSGSRLIDCKINPNVVAPFIGEFARLDGYNTSNE